MVVKKFNGRNTRDVLKQVRDELGADALILSNRQQPDGSIEIMAVADTEITALASGQLTAKQSAAKPVKTSHTPVVSSRALQRTYALPPELEEDEEPSLAYVRPSLPARQAPPPPIPSQTTPLLQRPMIASARVGGDVLPDDAPTPPNQPPFAPRYRYEPPEASAERIEPSLAAGEPPISPPPAAPPASVATAAPEQLKKIDAISHEVEDISSEIKLLRNMLEGQLAGLAWGELKRQSPERLEILRRMLAVGFSPALARQIVEHMPAGLSQEKSMQWARSALQHNLPTVPSSADIIDKGGVYALVGPTGVGKTTTVAKLAARATLMHGAARVALITTDGYRIGAQDQLRIYGKILGVPVYAITDETDLAQTLADLRNRHIVLIDTVGMSQRDQRVVDQIALLAGQYTHVQRLLLLSANAQGSTLDDVVRRFQGDQLAGCIFTKLDEAFALGAGLDVIIRYKLALYYITNGQRVPEDLHPASALYLVDRVFKTPDPAPAYRLKSEEYPLLMSNSNLDFSWT